MNIRVGQEAAKISDIKVIGQKRFARSAGPLIFLQPLDLQEHLVPHLKILLHTCLEPEA